MARSRAASLSDTDRIERRKLILRGQRAVLDSDLAELHGVPVKALNQAVKRNADRFPGDFAYRLTPQDWTDLKSHSVTSSSGHGGRRKLPTAFTEHGVAMLSSVLRAPHATPVNIEIMRAFVRPRRLMATPGELVVQLEPLAQSVRFHDGQLKAITDVLQRMMASPAAPPKQKIGFQPDTHGERETN